MTVTNASDLLNTVLDLLLDLFRDL